MTDDIGYLRRGKRKAYGRFMRHRRQWRDLNSIGEFGMRINPRMRDPYYGLGETPNTISGMDEVPTGDTTLQTGQNYTLVISLTGGITKPSDSTLFNEVQKAMGKLGVATVLSVSSTFGSSTYNIAIRMTKTVPYSYIMNILKLWIKQDLGYGVQEIDLIGGATRAGSIFSEVSAPVSKVADFYSGMLGNVKWIALAGLGLFGLWAILPAVRGTAKRIGNK